MKDESGKLATNKNGLAMTRKLKKNTALMALSNKNKTTKHTKNSKKKRCALMSTKKRKRGKKIQLRKKREGNKKKLESILTSTILLCTSTMRMSQSTSSSGNSTYINVLGAGDGGISTIGLDGIEECIDPCELRMLPSLV